jgi:hypothetical protein
VRKTTAIVLVGLLLYACGTTPSPAPATAPPTASSGTAAPPGTNAVAVTEAAATAPDAETPATVASDGITQEEDLLNPPVAPNTPLLEVTSAGLVIRWSGTGPDVGHYLVFGRPAPSAAWTVIGELPPLGDNLGDYSYVISEDPDTVGDYAVIAVDLDGNPSQLSIADRVDD